MPAWPAETWAVSCRQPGEWREGTSPSRSLRTVRDSLPSYGSHSPAFFCLGRSVGSSPEGLTSQTTVNCPAPSLRPHYRALTATTGRSAPVPRIGTLALAVFAACGSPSLRPKNIGRLYRGDRFSCSVPAPAMSSRHLYTEHRRGHIQAAPRLRTHRGEPLSRDHPQIPVSMPSLFRFDASAVVHTCSSSHRTPAPLTARRHPQRSPPRLLTDAACGGLESPPARRPRRTYLHHWHSTDRADDLLHHHHFPSGHTWVPKIWSCALTRHDALASWEPMCRILYRLLVSLARLAVRSGRSKDLEIIVLRHQLAVLRRQNNRPALADEDRALLGAIAAALPRRRRAGWLVTPETLLRWRRRRIARHWTQPCRAPGLWVPIIRSWALTWGFALLSGTRNRHEIWYTRTQHRPPSR